MSVLSEVFSQRDAIQNIVLLAFTVKQLQSQTVEHNYRVLHKNWDKLCFRMMACCKEWPFTFWGSLTSCCPSVLMASAKNGRMHPPPPPPPPPSGALLSFCLVCEIFLCTTFQTFLRRDFVTALFLVSFFATKPFLYTSCYTHNQIFSFGRSWGPFGVMTPTTFWGNSFELGIQQRALCCCHCCGRVAMSVSGFPRTNGRSFLLRSFRHKTGV